MQEDIRLTGTRRTVAAVLVALSVIWAMAMSTATAGALPPERIVNDWYRLVLNLVRHTATYSPPVASRGFAYLGVIAYEAAASGDANLQSLAGQLRDLRPVPKRDAETIYDDAVMIDAALAFSISRLFVNTGPTGQRAIAAMEKQTGATVRKDVDPAIVERSVAHGEAIAAHILEWARNDGGSVVENMGFPKEFAVEKGPGKWMPTNALRLQQLPLLPAWGRNRTFAMPLGTSCPVPPPPVYSEDKMSAFFLQAKEVFDVKAGATDETRAIARFWADDPMLSPTPPGHWISLALAILEREHRPVGQRAELLARLGIAVADGFIGCWQSKYEFNLVRPLTYIRKTMDKTWEPQLITPPFPEYPSGHSTQSGAAAVVLTAFFGQDYTFEDDTHRRDGLRPRNFKNFWAAAEEAALSRLYGGIHFRAAIEQGLEQGRCIGAFAAALKTRN